MLSVEECKKLIEPCELSEEQLEKLRSGLYYFAEKIIENKVRVDKPICEDTPSTARM